MTLPSPPQNPERVPRRRRWPWVLLLVLLPGIGALGWHTYTGRRAERQLLAAGFVTNAEVASLEARLLSAMHKDWRLLFRRTTWKMEPIVWELPFGKTSKLRNLDALAPALRRVNPECLSLGECDSLENVDGLKGLTALRELELVRCHALQNVDGLKGLVSLRSLTLCFCHSLQDVNGLKGLGGLQKLWILSSRSLRNVDGLKGLSSLENLHFSECSELEEVSGLHELTALRYIAFYGCFKLRDVRVLHGLPVLRVIDLRGCAKIAPEQIPPLKAAHPNAEILIP